MSSSPRDIFADVVGVLALEATRILLKYSILDLAVFILAAPLDNAKFLEQRTHYACGGCFARPRVANEHEVVIGCDSQG